MIYSLYSNIWENYNFYPNTIILISLFFLLSKTNFYEKMFVPKLLAPLSIWNKTKQS